MTTDVTGTSVGEGSLSRVLVTGGSGFIGRRVVRALMDEGADVTVADKRPFPGVGTLCELTVVGIPVAVGAVGERERLFEIAVSMAGAASDRQMLANQRIFGFGVIEIMVQSRSDDSLPAGCGVAGLTTLLPEAAFVRIAVAVIAFREGKSHVARLFVGSRCVTLFAFHLRVLPGQRIARFRMIESPGDIFPVREVVTRSASRPEASTMWIFVASSTSLRDADKTAVEVFDLDQCALGGGNMFRSMALPALHTRMLALEGITRLLVVEGLRVPLDQREVEPVMIGVALHALLAGSRPDSI